MRKTVVVDLDGTLLNTNTFKDYISYLGKESLMRLRLDICIFLFFWVVVRKFRIISHENMKKRILVCTNNFFSNYMTDFVSLLVSKINKSVISLVESYRNKGYSTILSTAAPERYAVSIGKYFKFESVVSTSDFISSDWRENVKEIKRDNTLKFLENTDRDLSVLITDHYDDIPLLSCPKEHNYLVNPSAKTIAKVKEAGIDYTII